MAKETEEKLIKTLQFLKDPQGSTIPDIVKVMNGQEPQVSLKKFAQALRGCLQNGTLTVSGKRVKLTQNDHKIGDSLRRDSRVESSSDRLSSQYPNKSSLSGKINGTFAKCNVKSRKMRAKEDGADGLMFGELNDEGEDGGEGGENGEGGGEGGNATPCPCATKKPKKAKSKKKRCPKKKPKCPKKKPKPKCGKPKPKKCAKRKVQSYCKKKRSCQT